MAAPSRFKITQMKNGRWSLFDRMAPSPLGGGDSLFTVTLAGIAALEAYEP